MHAYIIKRDEQSKIAGIENYCQMRGDEESGALRHNGTPLRFYTFPEMPEKPPKGFSYSRKTAFIKEKVSQAALRLPGLTLRGQDYKTVCAVCANIMGIVGRNAAIERTLSRFKDLPLTNSVLFRILLRIDACADLLKANIAVPEWYGVPDVWAYCVVTDIKLEHINAKSLAFVTADLYTGKLAGMSYRLAFPTAYIKKLIHELGYPAYKKAHPLELFGFHFNVMLGVGHSNRVNAVSIAATSAQKKLNRRLSKRRYTRKCPVPVICAMCAVGADRCPYACKPITQKGDSHDSIKTPHVIRRK